MENFTTTFKQDLLIAESFGTNAIKDTVRRSLKSFSKSPEYLASLSIELNSRLFDTYNKGQENLAIVYDEEWRKVNDFCFDNLKGDDLKLFIELID